MPHPQPAPSVAKLPLASLLAIWNLELKQFWVQRGDGFFLLRATSPHVRWWNTQPEREVLTALNFSVISQAPCWGWMWTPTCATCLTPYHGATPTSTAPTSPQKYLPMGSMIQAGEDICLSCSYFQKKKKKRLEQGKTQAHRKNVEELFIVRCPLAFFL